MESYDMVNIFHHSLISIQLVFLYAHPCFCSSNIQNILNCSCCSVFAFKVKWNILRPLSPLLHIHCKWLKRKNEIFEWIKWTQIFNHVHVHYDDDNEEELFFKKNCKFSPQTCCVVTCRVQQIKDLDFARCLHHNHATWVMGNIQVTH